MIKSKTPSYEINVGEAKDTRDQPAKYIWKKKGASNKSHSAANETKLGGTGRWVESP